MACAPFVPAELADYYRRVFDWQTPQMLAALPLAVLVVWWLLRLSGWPPKNASFLVPARPDRQPTFSRRGFIAAPLSAARRFTPLGYFDKVGRVLWLASVIFVSYK